MNSELLFEGKKYVSSKRASKISRYNQDYIGQLIRDSKLDARRVGRAWFISLESLERHLGKIKGKEPKISLDPVQGVDLDSKPLFFDGKKFIPSKEASEFSGYSRDYIGQLVRDSKLEARMVGRQWYVSLVSLEKHIGRQSKIKDVNRDAQLATLSKTPVQTKSEVSLVSKYEKEIVHTLPAVPKKDIKLGTEKLPSAVYPVVEVRRAAKQKMISPFTHFKRAAVVGLVSVALVFAANAVHFSIKKSEITRNQTSVLSSASAVSASSFESFAVDWFKFVNGRFTRIGGFFASIFGTSQIAYQSQQDVTKPVTQGMVVMPKTTENEETVERIKSSFSDQVGVSRNPDGISGVITPVFQKVSGDEYLYVLVPVKEDKR